jgi:predicted ATPase/DNA-binding CsgD family transcriptional regulator
VGRSAAATTDGGLHGFPASLTSFVGRGGAVHEVASLLDQYRLVTVTGPGGAGKTRLACELAGHVGGRFADGVWLAELAAVRDPALVASVVAVALGVRDLPGVPTTDALTRVLARRQLLLVLDNCEHVIGAAAELCATLLPACDDVRVLATSREPLRVAGEARYRLGSLSLPGRNGATDADGSEAVALFADRARRIDAGFALTGDTGPAVAQLVARLDGMPLAIELAAARVEALGVAQLLERLDDRFGLLTAGDRVAAGRQQSLAATVQWSYRLLDERERRVFRLVSVFPGPFTLEAAEAVAGADAGPAVLRLVDCSLLVPPRVGRDGQARYLMLETLRAYGARLLTEAGEEAGAAAALAGYALRVAEEAGAGLETGAGEVAAARRLDAEDATMRQALAWAMDHDPRVAPRLAVVLAWWWLLRGRLAGQSPLLREVAARAAPGSGAWCAAQFWLGTVALFSADLAGALGHYTAVRDATGDRRPPWMLADCLSARSIVLANLNRLAEAADDGHRALALARELGYPAGEALALASVSISALCAGDLDGAVRLARQAQQITADIPGSIARMCSNILTDALTYGGDLTAAERICAAGLAQSQDVGDLWTQARLLQQMAILDLQAGRTEDAVTHLREGLQVALQTGGGMALVNGLDCCGYLCAATGRFDNALTVWAAHAAFFRHGGFTDAPLYVRRRDEPLREARQALGRARVQAAEDRGAAMSLDTAAEYALMLTAPEPSAAAPGPGKLSARERELVTLVAQGHTDAQIAAQLYISVRTVSSHLDRIRDKTGCRRRADLTRLALSAGLV